MYWKCGRLDIVVKVLKLLPKKSIVGWNSLISTFGFHGHGQKSIDLSWKMNDSRTTTTKSTLLLYCQLVVTLGLLMKGEIANISNIIYLQCLTIACRNNLAKMLLQPSILCYTTSLTLLTSLGNLKPM